MAGWRHAVHKATEADENERQSSQQAKRAAMTARTITAEHSTECPVYSRLCASEFGLRFHMGVHKQSARLDFIDHSSRPFTCQAPGVTGSVLGLAGPVSEH